MTILNVPYNPKPSISIGYRAHDPSSYIQTQTRTPLTAKPTAGLTRADNGVPALIGESGHSYAPALVASNSLIPRVIS